MHNDIKSFVLLKYKILTHDNETWHLSDTYPIEVRNKWSQRCAEDVEHLSNNHTVKTYINVSKQYKQGLVDFDKYIIALNNLNNDHMLSPVMSAYYAYVCSDKVAVYAVSYAASGDINNWNLYISWLIEELCEYENKHG